MIKSVKFFVILSMCIGSNLVFAETQNNDQAKNLKQNLDSILENIRVENNIPAMAVGVINDGAIHYQHGFGVTSTEQVVTSKSKFRVASITKLFTAQAVMQLVEQGKIKLNDNIGKYLPEAIDQDISILELMTHHSGLKDKIKPKSRDKGRIVSQYVQQSIDKQGNLNKSFKYADLNFNLLGAIVAKVSGKTYENYINDHILTPLNLVDSGFIQLNSKFAPDVEPYINGWLLRKASERPFDPSFSPSEGLVTNIYDLLNWLNATLSQHNALLKAHTFKEMLVPRQSTEWGDIKMGLGWQLYNNEYGKVIQHAGSFKGVKALLIAYPDIQRGIIILTNADEVPRWDIANSINKVLDSK